MKRSTERLPRRIAQATGSVATGRQCQP